MAHKYVAICNDILVKKADDFETAYKLAFQFAIDNMGSRDFKGVSVCLDGKKLFEIDREENEYVCGVPVNHTVSYGQKVWSFEHRNELIDKLIYGKSCDDIESNADELKQFEVGNIYGFYNGKGRRFKVVERRKNLVTVIDWSGKSIRRRVKILKNVEYFYPYTDKRQYGEMVDNILRADSLVLETQGGE